MPPVQRGGGSPVSWVTSARRGWRGVSRAGTEAGGAESRAQSQLPTGLSIDECVCLSSTYLCNYHLSIIYLSILYHLSICLPSSPSPASRPAHLSEGEGSEWRVTAECASVSARGGPRGASVSGPWRPGERGRPSGSRCVHTRAPAAGTDSCGSASGQRAGEAAEPVTDAAGVRDAHLAWHRAGGRT